MKLQSKRCSIFVLLNELPFVAGISADTLEAKQESKYGRRRKIPNLFTVDFVISGTPPVTNKRQTRPRKI